VIKDEVIPKNWGDSWNRPSLTEIRKKRIKGEPLQRKESIMARFLNRPLPIFAVVLILSLLVTGACKTEGEAAPSDEDAIAAEEAAAAEAAAKEAAAKPAPPKVTEENYIEIIARSVLIRQKHAEDAATGEKEVETLYEKAGLTFADVKEYENKIGPSNVALLQPKIQEKIQKLLPDYR
jgi:uncharacterized membrane protein